MRLLLLAKRQYTQHDLLDDRFGRLRELPLALARRGHEVRGLCLSYAPRPEGPITDRSADSNAAVEWLSLNVGRLWLPGLWRYARRAARLAGQFRPDIVWSTSDSLYGVLGRALARRANARHVFDLYDNFEYFATTRVPGMRRAYRAAVRTADGVTCVSEPLAARVREEYGRAGPTLVLPNGIDRDQFRPLDRGECRRALGLPADAQLIGTAGALSETRGILTLFHAAERLMAERAGVHLVLAGPRDRGLRLPSDPRVHDLGVLDYDAVPRLVSALDVAVICNRDSEFGRYCFPQKAHEFIACGVPVVASNVGVAAGLLKDCPGALCRPEDGPDMARALGEQLDRPCRVAAPPPDWDELGAMLERFLLDVAGGPRR